MHTNLPRVINPPTALRQPRRGPGPSTPGPGSAWASPTESPREAATLTCARPRAKRILKAPCQVLENFAKLKSTPW